MLKKISLGITGWILLVCWLFTLFETGHRGRLHIDIDDEALFIALSILLVGWVVALNLPSFSQASANRLASDYVKFISTIRDRSITLEELANEIGEDSGYVSIPNGAGKMEPKLSEDQKDSLQKLIYEGKIILRDGQHSLP